MRKLFTLAAAVLASFSLWAETVTFTAAEIKAGTAKSGITPYFDANPANKNLCKDGQTQNKADVCEVKNSSDTILVSSLKEQAQVLFTANEKYITKIVVNGATNSTGSGAVKNIPALYWKGNAITESFDGAELVSFSGYDVACENAYYTFQNLPEKTQIAGIFRRVKVDNATNPTKKVNKSGVNFGDGQTFYVASVEITYENACTDPESTIKGDTTLYVNNGYNIGFSSINTNGCTVDVKKNGAAAVDDVDYSKTNINNYTFLKAGEFVITISQAMDANNHCAVEESVTVTVLDASPVTAVTIDGPAAGVIGQELTYTATAVGATAYEWYLDGNKQGSDSAKFIYTAVKGDHSIVCKARNEFNAEDTWIASDAKEVVVTKVCGELIKVTLTNNKAGDLSGVLTGTKDINASTTSNTFDEKTGYKLGGNGQYVGVSGLSGTLMAGDTAIVYVTNASANLQLFSDKGTTKIGEKIGGVVQGENKIALNAAATGKNAIYLYRADITGGGSSMNPNVYSLAVTRECAESDNNNATVTINGDVAEKSGTVFNYTLSASYDAATVAVEITLEHPLATLMEDHAASFTMPTPEVGTPSVETFKVKAENGEQAWYSIFVNKSASLSSNADLSALSVAGLTLSPDFAADVTEYTVTKAYEAAMPAVGDVTATPADANAKGAEVTIAGNVITVTVTAENDDTKVYTITVNNAPALKSLSQVKFANGFDAFIDNTNHTVKAFYLAGDAAPEAAAIVAGNGTAGPLSEGKIVVTGADDSTVDYIVTLEAVTPNTDVVEEAAAAGTFDGTEAWVKAGLYLGNAAGFNAGKYVLRRQLKSGDKADDQRVIAGWVRAYFFVGNASKLELANTANKKVKYAIDGGEYTESEAEALVIELEAGNHMIEIVTNQSSGDCNLSAPKLVKRVATALDNAADEVKAVKRIENGQLLIEKNGRTYNVLGSVIR